MVCTKLPLSPAFCTALKSSTNYIAAMKSNYGIKVRKW